MIQNGHMKKNVALSLPNILTYGRIAAVPALAGCLYFEGHTLRWVALGLFFLAAISDFFDGYLASAWQQQSALGDADERDEDAAAEEEWVAAAARCLDVPLYSYSELLFPFK